MDLTIIERVTAAVGGRGATTVAAHTFFDIVRKLPEGAQVQIESTGDGGQVTLKAGRSRFVLQTLPKEDFPTMGAGDLPHKFEIAAKELRNLIDRTRFAISTEETRYI
jgi:DNA polymerase-3 subunit beta